MRTLKTQSDHDKMVKTMADTFEGEGMQVKADHIGHRNGRPDPINGYVPDVEATNMNRTVILEAETHDTISDESTNKQMQAFSTVNGAEFHVIVPEGYTEAMRKQAMEWGIHIDKFWSMEV